MCLEDVDRLDGILDLPFVVGTFDCHGCIDHHVGEEISISIGTVGKGRHLIKMGGGGAIGPHS